jgi:tetratricopeptide (TPR) repeat protein
MRLLCILILALYIPACAPSNTRSYGPPAQHRQWAQELLLIHDRKGAIVELQLSLKGNPNVADALLYADLLESQGDYKQARKAYKKAFKYPAEENQKQSLNYRLALLEATDLDNLNTASKLAKTLPPVDSRYFDLQSVLLLKQKVYKRALEESQRALTKAQNNEEKGWAYFHMAQIYYELRNEQETFRSLFEATNNGRGYSLVARITEYWESKRHDPFPKD